MAYRLKGIAANRMLDLILMQVHPEIIGGDLVNRLSDRIKEVRQRISVVFQSALRFLFDRF